MCVDLAGLEPATAGAPPPAPQAQGGKGNRPSPSFGWAARRLAALSRAACPLRRPYSRSLVVRIAGPPPHPRVQGAAGGLSRAATCRFSLAGVVSDLHRACIVVYVIVVYVG